MTLYNSLDTEQSTDSLDLGEVDLLIGLSRVGEAINKSYG